jgi:magnesium transporter
MCPVQSGADVEHIRIRARPICAEGVARDISSGELAATMRDEQQFVWIDVLYPQTEAGAMLRDSIGLEPLTLEDCLAPLRMPKVDVIGDSGVFVAAFALRLEQHDEPRLRAVELDLVIGPGSLLTVRHDPLEEVVKRLEAQLGAGAVPFESGAAELAHAGVDALIDGQLVVMVHVAELAEQLDEQLDPRCERSSVTALESLIVLRRDLLAFRRLAVAQQETLRRLGRLAPGVAARFGDVGDNQREIVEMADATRDYIDGVIEAYRMRRDERTGSGVRRLTILAAVLGPLSLLTGLFGVNFRAIPGTDYDGGFYVFVAIQILLAAFALWLLHRRGLL